MMLMKGHLYRLPCTGERSPPDIERPGLFTEVIDALPSALHSASRSSPRKVVICRWVVSLVSNAQISRAASETACLRHSFSCDGRLV